MSVNLVKKISVGGINNVRKGFKGITQRTVVGRIVGIARVAKWEEGDLGAYCKFTGDFRAWNQEGEAFAGPVAFLPEPAQSMLANAVTGDESGSGVEFAFDFVASPNESSVTGYEWQAVPLLEAKVSDPMAAILNKISAPALAAPKAPTGEPDQTTGEIPAENAAQENAAAADSKGAEAAASAKGGGKKK